MANDKQDPADYEIGYRKPPRAHCFKPGQSGNPRGRPRGAKSLKTVLAEELGQKITVNDNGREVRISKMRAIIRAHTIKAAKGHVGAASWLVGLHIQAEGLQDDRTEGNRLSGNDQAILDRYLSDQDGDPS